MPTNMLPGDLNTLAFNLNADLFSTTADVLTAAIPGSMWSVNIVGAGHLSGRVGCVEIELYAAPEGGWSLSAGPTTYRPADLGEFELNAYGASAVELVQEALGDAWLAVAMASRFEA